MGLLALKRLMSMQRKRNRGHVQAHNGSIASLAKRNGSPCQQDDAYSQGGKRIRYSGPDLPEDIWRHIHSLLPLRDAARAACVSHAFLRSWRCHPNLTFNMKTMCLKESLRVNHIIDYNNKIDRVLRNHSRVGVKTLMLQFRGPYNAKSYYRLNSWLQIAVTPAIEQLTLTLLSDDAKYEFPCSLLPDRSADSLRYLYLINCSLRPKVELGLRSLTMLHLYRVRITGDELGLLLSNSCALEKLMLIYCDDIICLEIPCLLQCVSYLQVVQCMGLQVIKNKAPNISSIWFAGNQVQLSLGELLQVKHLKLDHRNVICYAIEKLPSSVPNLEKLIIFSLGEMVHAPMAPSKFLHLKFLSICLRGWNFNRDYDYLSLVSFFDASPSLETFLLFIAEQSKYDSIVGDPLSLRQMPEHHHDNLKRVKITGFCPQNSLVELTRHILENTSSLEYLALDTTVSYRCSGNISDRKCPPLDRAYIRELRKAILAVRTCIEAKVPSTVKLNVLDPCSRCHAW